MEEEKGVEKERRGEWEKRERGGGGEERGSGRGLRVEKRT